MKWEGRKKIRRATQRALNFVPLLRFHPGGLEGAAPSALTGRQI
jgi:hypothetical protein